MERRNKGTYQTQIISIGENAEENGTETLCRNCKCALSITKTNIAISTQTCSASDSSEQHGSGDDSSDRCEPVSPDSSTVPTSCDSQCSKNQSEVTQSNPSNETKDNKKIVPSKVRSIKKIFKNSKQHPPNPDSLPPCRVCGEKASGLHYGVNTCEPCKGFFRRSIVKVINNKEEYKCIRDTGNCKLGTGKRTMCSYCRYIKCLEVGMAHDAIKIGRYTYNKRNSDYLEVKQLKLHDKKINDDTTNKTVSEISSNDASILSTKARETEFPSNPNMHTDSSICTAVEAREGVKVKEDTALSDLDVEQIQNLTVDIPSQNQIETTSKKYSYIGNYYEDKIDSVEAERLMEELISIQEIVDPDFRMSYDPESLREKQELVYELHKQKQKVFGNLGTIPANIYDEFHEATGIEIDDRKEKMNLLAVMMDMSIRNMISFARQLPGFSDLCKEDQAALLKAGYNEYGFIGFHNRLNVELSVVSYNRPLIGIEHGLHLSEFSSVLAEGEFDKLLFFAERLQKCRYSAEEATLVRGIVLTFTDRTKLQNPEKVEKIQMKLVNILRYICKKKCSNPDKRLWQIFDKFALLREFSEYKKKLLNVKAKWPVMQSHPLVLEIIGS